MNDAHTNGYEHDVGIDRHHIRVGWSVSLGHAAKKGRRASLSLTRRRRGLTVLRGLDLVDEAGTVAAAALVGHAGAARLEVVVDVGSY